MSIRLKWPRRAYDQQRWSHDREAILEFNRSLSLIADTDALMPSIAARISEIFGADRIVILRELSDNGVFTVAFSTGHRQDDLNGLHLGSNGRLARWLLNNETAFLVRDSPGVLDYLTESERELLARLDVRICLPLITLNRLTGLVFLSASDRDWTLDSEGLRLLQMLVSQAGIAFENADLYRQQRDRLRTLYRAERLAAAGQIAASVAHEVRNPLTAIRSTVQYLLGDFDETNPKRSLIEGVIAEVDRIDRTVDGLLSLTRQAEFTPERVALGELIEQSVLLLRTQARKQSIEICWSPESGEDFYTVGDVSQLKELLLNLLLNALQAMPEGGRLEVQLTGGPRSSPLARGTNWAQVTIIDTGCGIPAEHLERIFEPFFTNKQGGTGLGLPISYAIAKRHGGRIEVYSVEGDGTSVAVRLPLVR